MNNRREKIQYIGVVLADLIGLIISIGLAWGITVARPLRRDFVKAVKFNLLMSLINSAGLALTKAAMLDSRYFLLFVPVINVFTMTVTHAALKEVLKNTYKMRGLQSLVGVITTADHAENMIGDL